VKIIKFGRVGLDGILKTLEFNCSGTYATVRTRDLSDMKRGVRFGNIDARQS
jgi:hypothetical protein